MKKYIIFYKIKLNQPSLSFISLLLIFTLRFTHFTLKIFLHFSYSFHDRLVILGAFSVHFGTITHILLTNHRHYLNQVAVQPHLSTSVRHACKLCDPYFHMLSFSHRNCDLRFSWNLSFILRLPSSVVLRYLHPC